MEISLLTKCQEIARELEGSGNAPADLVNLVSKPCTKGNNEMFKTHALGSHSQIMKGQHNDNWTNLVTTHNAFHQDSAQSGDCEEGGGSTNPDAKLQALIAPSVKKKFKRLQATGDHGLGGCNDQSRNGNQETTRSCFECGESRSSVVMHNFFKFCG